MPVHQEVLEAARRIGAERGDWTFTPQEIVRALPHLNARTIRTHVTSRCCVNAPRNHLHRWAYFERIARGQYRVKPAVRGDRSRASEARADYGRHRPRFPVRSVIHTVISPSEGYFVAECLEIAVVTQGRTLDEVVANLREAVTLHLASEDLQSLGLASSPRLALSYETSLSGTPS